jgi:hypothetical protein
MILVLTDGVVSAAGFAPHPDSRLNVSNTRMAAAMILFIKQVFLLD